MGKRVHVLAVLALVLGAAQASAISTGIEFYSGNPATGGQTCSACHSGGVVPSVTLTGPAVVFAGEVNTYMLTITGGQNLAGGLGVSASSGTLSVSDSGTWLLGAEIVHNTPRFEVGGQISWSFNWTAPLSAGTTTIYGAGNSVNMAQGPNRDEGNTDQLVVSVVAATATPGETSGPAYSPLRVTAYDPSTGDLTIEYGTACETSGNNVYFGPLDQLSSLAWSDEQCAIGISGAAAAINGGAGSYFFVVVGNKDLNEGSYGRSRADTLETERPPFASNACGEQQLLDEACN